MPKSTRDDFSPAMKRKIAKRAAHRCSFPGCGAPTSGPSAERPDAASEVGVACHITAAAAGPGARRYDPALTPQQRKSADNGIWMCQTHEKLIDTDDVTYTVEVLRQYKAAREDQAHREIGQPASAGNAAHVEHDRRQFHSLSALLGEREMLDVFEELTTDDAVWNGERNRIDAFRRRLHQPEGEFLLPALARDSVALRTALDDLLRFLAYNFYPFGNTPGRIRFCLHPDLNLDRARVIPSSSQRARYGEFQEELDACVASCREAYAVYRRTVKRLLAE